MVDFGMNKNPQGVAISRPAAQLPPKEGHSGFTVQRTTLQPHYPQQQPTLSARGVVEGSPHFPVGQQLSSEGGSARGNPPFPGVRSDGLSRFPGAGGRGGQPMEFSPIQAHPTLDSKVPKPPFVDDFLLSNHGSNLGSLHDLPTERVAFADKNSPNMSSIPNFLVGGSPPSGVPKTMDFPSEVQKLPSGSLLDEQNIGQPSYQRYVPGTVVAKGVGTLAGKKGGPKRNELTVGKGRFIMKSQIGAGSFGEIFWGIDTISNKEVAIKLESVKVRHPQLQYESRIYKLLHNKETNFHPSITRYNKNTFITNNKVVPTRGGAFVEALRSGQGQSEEGSPNSKGKVMLLPATFQELREVVGFPHCYYYGTEGEYNVMVMDLLGPNLEDLFNYCHRRFSLKTVCLIADQMLHRIEYLHHKGFIHRDLKPENFVMGGDEEHAHILHLIDYGLSKRYLDPRTNLHVTYKEGKSLTGTARYCSINAHMGVEQSRRDDIEALGYIILYFLKRGFLPWQGIRGAPDPQTKNVRISEKKINTRLEVLCRDEPPQIFKFMTYARGLKFEETPDYTSCREFFATLVDRHNWERDWIYDWVIRRQSERHKDQPQQQMQAIENPNVGFMSRLPMMNNPAFGEQRNLDSSPPGYSELEAKNSSQQNNYGLNSPTELSVMLSAVDDRDYSGVDKHHAGGGGFAPHNKGHQDMMRSNKVHMQPQDLPGDMEYML